MYVCMYVSYLLEAKPEITMAGHGFTDSILMRKKRPKHAEQACEAFPNTVQKRKSSEIEGSSLNIPINVEESSPTP